MSHRKKIWNVPNVLTMIRMILIPVYWVVFYKVADPFYVEGCKFHFWALIIFAVASLTDAADGYIARRYDMITDFGKLFDPMADKMMNISVMLTLAAYINRWFFWIALVMIMIKELCMITGGLIMLNKNIVVYSNIWGKVAQAFIVFSIILSFFHDYFMQIFKLFDVFPINAVLIWIGVALAYIAGIQYLRMAIKMVNENGTEGLHE